jgi:hypothetical protein
LPPLGAGHTWLESIAHDGHDLAKVSVPLGATTRRPMMLALHGGNDRADWACGEWRGVIDAYAFILCPRGNASGLYWDSPRVTAAQIETARADLDASFGAYVEGSRPSIVAGFSAGAIMAIALVQAGLVEPDALVLSEGGYGQVADPGFASSLAAHHVKRVLFSCTTQGACPAAFKDALPKLVRAGIDARLNVAPTNQHGMWTEVIASLRKEWPWLVRDIAGWEGFG